MATITCKQCLQNKPATAYRKYDTVCPQCHTSRRRTKINNDVLLYFKRLLSTARNHAQQRKQKGRMDAGVCTLTLQDLVSMYEHQEGVCYYSGMQLSLRLSTDWQCSLERLNPDHGYVKDNVVLIALEFNHVVQWNTLKYKEFVTLLFETHEGQHIERRPRKQPGEYHRQAPIMLHGITHYMCKYCRAYLPAPYFYAKEFHRCKTCVSHLSKGYHADYQGNMRNLWSSMRSGARTRNMPVPTLSIDDFYRIFNEQKGLCAYSNIPMTFGSSKEKNWTCSIERRDPKKPYTANNVCFVCLEFNTLDRRSIIKHSDYDIGSCGWSSKKIDMVRLCAYLWQPHRATVVLPSEK